MKYIENFKLYEKHNKTYEKRRTVDYKGYRQKKQEEIEKTNRFKNLIPGLYIVVAYNHGNYYDEIEPTIILGRILGLEYPKLSRYYQSKYDDYVEEVNLKLTVIDYIEPYPTKYEWIKLDVNKSFNMNLLDVKFISNGLASATIKYKELAAETQIKVDARKYN